MVGLTAGGCSATRSSSGFGSDMQVFVTAGVTKHFVLCSLCFGSALPERARSLRSPYAEVEPFGFAPSLKINSLDTNGVQTIYTHGGSRTHDPLLRRQLLYPTELREQVAPQYRKNTLFCKTPKELVDIFRIISGRIAEGFLRIPAVSAIGEAVLCKGIHMFGLAHMGRAKGTVFVFHVDGKV